MRLCDLIPRKAILANLKAADKRGAVKELVAVVKSAYDVPKYTPAQVVDIVMRREELGSTGLGGGVAVPHARVEGISKAYGAFGRHAKGLDFNALDGESVHLIFLLISPAEAPGEYQKALKQTMEAIRQPNFCRFLRGAKTAKEIEEIFREAEENTVRVP